MENSGFEFNGEEEHLELPPGFRFHPTDEELISHYLSPKALDATFTAKAVGEVDLNKAEPWDLPKLAKMGEHEWYFFSVRDKKYPNGLRTNRATDAGYWKATGKDKEVQKGTSLVGLKKTLVFYIGRAPKGEKSNWIMHEYRLSPQILPSLSKSEWVICRIYHKSSSGRCQFTGQELPTLSETSPYIDQTSLNAQSIYSVPSFSTPTLMNTQGAAQSDHNPMLGALQTAPISPSYLPQGHYPRVNEAPYPVYPFKGINSQYQFGVYPDHHQAMYFGSNLEINNGGGTTDQLNPMGFGGSISQDTCLSNDLSAEISSVVSNYRMGRGPFDDQAGPLTSVGPIDIDSIWNF